jgi:hypothetical protein
MKAYVLMLLIGTIAALSEVASSKLASSDEAARRNPGQVPLIAAAVRRIGRTLSQRTSP